MTVLNLAPRTTSDGSGARPCLRRISRVACGPPRCEVVRRVIVALPARTCARARSGDDRGRRPRAASAVELQPHLPAARAVSAGAPARGHALDDRQAAAAEG